MLERLFGYGHSGLSLQQALPEALLGRWGYFFLPLVGEQGGKLGLGFPPLFFGLVKAVAEVFDCIL